MSKIGPIDVSGSVCPICSTICEIAQVIEGDRGVAIGWHLAPCNHEVRSFEWTQSGGHVWIAP